MVNNFALIIVTYNGSKWIRQCLNSVYSSSIVPHCIVVDNNSSDNTVDIIKQHYHDVELVQLKSNLGFGGANNIGFQRIMQIGVEYVYLLNQDAYVYNSTFEELIRVMDNHKDYGICSPIQLDGYGCKLEESFVYRLIDTFKNNAALLSDSLVPNKKLHEVYETNFVMAAHWMIRVSSLREVGLFSPAFPHYGEDNNLIYRFIYHGMKVGICPLVYACHYGREGRTVNNMQRIIHLRTCNRNVCHNILIGWKRKAYLSLRLFAKLLLFHGVSVRYKIKSFIQMIFDIARTNNYLKKYRCKGAFMDL